MFGRSWKLRLRPSRSAEPAAAAPARLEDVRLQILAALGDCESGAAERIRSQIRSVRSGGDLLLLRGDIYQAVAREHCEAEARRRLDALLPMLRGWVPEAGRPRF